MKNPMLFKITTTKILVVLMASLVFFSCKKEDDDPALPVESSDVLFEVRLVKMVSLEIKESEGEHLEVYGTVNANLIRGNVTEENVLWSTTDSDYISVGLSDFPMNAAVTFSVSPENISESTMEVTSALTEHDFSESNPDDNLASETISTPLSSVTSTSTFQMVHDGSSGQHVQVTFSITRL